MPEDPYSVLELSPSASLNEIQMAYRKLAIQHHPDLGGDRQKFQQLSDAYQVLLKSHDAIDDLNLDEAAESTVNAKPKTDRNSFPDSVHAPPGFHRNQSAKRKTKKAADRFSSSEINHLLTGKLPLQDQTTYFILVNALDIFLTYLILQTGGFEANPIAAWFIHNWGKYGMIWFKLTIVTIVCVIAQVIALRSHRKAGMLLNLGTCIIGCVVLYSVWLLAS